MNVLLTPKTLSMIWLSNLSTLIVADEGCSGNASCELNFDIYVLLKQKKAFFLTCISSCITDIYTFIHIYYICK
jgi:hypothetical protein